LFLQANSTMLFACFTFPVLVFGEVQMNRSQMSLLLIGLCVVGFVVGCKKSGLDLPTGTVSGTVTSKGKPLADATITFFGENHGDTATGVLQSDGTYTLKYGTGFGIPVGDYRVAIVTGAGAGGPPPNPADLMKTVDPGVAKKNAVPDKYRDPKTSGLIAVVKEGANTDLNFDLK
jgi:hypothetical protein